MASQAVLPLHNKAALQGTKLLRSFVMLENYFDISTDLYTHELPTASLCVYVSLWISVKLYSFQIGKLSSKYNARYSAIKGHKMYDRIARVR